MLKKKKGSESVGKLGLSDNDDEGDKLWSG